MKKILLSLSFLFALSMQAIDLNTAGNPLLGLTRNQRSAFYEKEGWQILSLIMPKFCAEAKKTEAVVANTRDTLMINDSITCQNYIEVTYYYSKPLAKVGKAEVPFDHEPCAVIRFQGLLPVMFTAYGMSWSWQILPITKCDGSGKWFVYTPQSVKECPLLQPLATYDVSQLVELTKQILSGTYNPKGLPYDYGCLTPQAKQKTCPHSKTIRDLIMESRN